MRILIISLFLIYIPATLISQNSEKYIKPEAKSGILDLSDYSFKDSGVLQLNGEWLFIKDEFVNPTEVLSTNNSSILKVPSLWHRSIVNGEKLSAHGFATYNLKIVLPESVPNKLALKIPEVGTAYSVFVNGEKIAQVGNPGKEKSSSVPQSKIGINPIYNSEKVWNITIHVSNYHYYWGGIWDPIELGDFDGFVKERGNSIKRIFFYCGIFIMMALFHFIFFLLRKKDHLSFSFALLCVLFFIRLLSVDDLFVLELLPNLSFSVIKKMRFGSFYLGVPVFAIFLKHAFPQEFKKAISYFTSYIGIASTIVVVITPPLIFIETLAFYHSFTYLVIIYSIYVVVLAKIRKREGATLFLFGLSVFFIFFINNMLYTQKNIQAGLQLNTGLLLLVIFQSILVNLRFAKSYNLNIKLSEELQEKNQNLLDLTHDLERRVGIRKSDLKKAYNEIKSLALTDELTGLSNRRSVMELITFEENKAIHKNHIFTLGLMDIDNFKMVNDTYGHDIGDEVLKTVAKIIQGTLRKQDIVSRWGGEEFLLLFPDTGLNEAFKVAERVRIAIEENTIPVGKKHITVSATIGICTYNKGLGIEGVLKKADEGLYIGKNNGKNQVVKMTK